MLRPRKVAIIGAGPAGLVTAKTLLQNFPEGTFTPTIFERRHEIGGLWPSRSTTNDRTISAKKNDSVGTVNPSMRTNLSRYTVAFSDLSWESVFESQDVPMFPQAWQVGMYLEKYVERYIPPGMIKLGHNVVQTIRSDAEMRWTVKWVVESDHQERHVMSDCFDYLVVASGFFSTPYIPDIPGLSSFKERTVHNMALDTPGILQNIIPESKTTGNKIVVIGGSMSGAEAASNLALRLSSEKHTACSSSPLLKDYEVHHISTKPFWAIPTYLPQITADEYSGKEEAASFPPLDLVFYNLSHRPPGPVQYSFGPLSTEQISQLNDRFRSLLGSEYETYGYVNSKRDGLEKDKPQPTFLAIGNDYAEFVRSKAISPTIGRVCGITRSASGSVRVYIRLPDGEMTMLDDVAAIIMATGFTPHKSLSFLPEEVLSILEYASTDSFLPIILDGKGSMHAEIPDLGFVGFYKGPYWGAMEMQARLLGEIWATASPGDASHLSDAERRKRAEERQAMRDFRSADPDFYRGQLPMADYTGLMESFARNLGIPRAQLADFCERDGPVVPARFSFDKTPSGPACDIKEKEVKTTLDSLRTTLNPQNNITSPGLAMAIFRALHGAWKFTRTYHYEAQPQSEKKVFGTAAFHPRHPSRIEYEKEYLYEETEHDTEAPNTESRYRSAYGLLDPLPRSDGTYIHRWLMDENSEDQFLYGLTLASLQQKVRNGVRVPGEYTVLASGPGRTDRGIAGDVPQYGHVFNMEGVAITSWLCSMAAKEGEVEIRTSYTR